MGIAIFLLLVTLLMVYLAYRFARFCFRHSPGYKHMKRMEESVNSIDWGVRVLGAKKRD